MKSASGAVIPLESNPEIFTDLAHKIGLLVIIGFHDVYSLSEPDLLCLLPQPVYGVVLLLPIGAAYEQYRMEQDKSLEPSAIQSELSIIWYKQTIGNGCGLYALLHLLSNLPSGLLVEDLLCDDLVAKVSKGNDNEQLAEKVAVLVEELSRQIPLNEEFGKRGQTEAPKAEAKVDLHFVSFIRGKDNHIYELDGRRKGPIDLGKASLDENSLCSEPALARKIQFYMDGTEESNKNRFAMMAIAPVVD